ncbi:MAG: hypothetical protein HQL29_04235 [Candidatus Omnitrophica bacterium]|nr:hypothetical protein [Candidatus Omnitrophota bacterium]
MMKLKNREKILLGCIAVLLLLFSVERFIVSPFSGKLEITRIKMKNAESRLNRLYRLDAQSDSIKNVYAEIKNFIEASQAGEDILPAVMNEMENIAYQNEVKLINMKPEQPDNEEKNFYKTRDITLKIEGQQKDIITFIYKIETGSYALRISRIDMKVQDEKLGIMECNINIEFLYFNG